MKATFRKALTGVGALALAGSALVATSGSALASPPPYYPDAGATLGGLDFFNSSGVQITSGTLTASPFVGYAVAQYAPSGGGTKAAYYAYTPVNGSAPGTWGGAQLGGGTNYPISTPSDLAGLTNPIVTGVSGDTDLSDYISTHANTDTSTTDGYAGIYAIRVKVTGQTGYATADIYVSGSTWTQVDGTFQLFADTTSTTLSVTPPSPSVPGTSETLKATVADTTTPATVPTGTVAFFNGSTQVGTTQTLSAGTAQVTVTLPTGVASLTAVFTSGTPSTIAGSTSPAVPYTVAALDGSSTSLSLNPTTGAAFTPVTLTSTVSDTTTPATIPTGSVNFFDGTTLIGSAALAPTGTPAVATAVYTDSAGFSFTSPGSGTPPSTAHSITAVFVPTTGETVAGSTSAAVVYSATAPACPNGEAATLCTDAQTVTATVAAGTITITTPYTATSPLNLGTLVLNSSGTLLSVSAPFGSNASTAQEIFVTDTRAGDPNWTASVQSGNFTSATTTTPIDGQNAGLTGLTIVPVAGNALTASNVTVTNNPPGTAPIVTGGSQGLGGAKHTFAQTTAGGDGSVGFTGTFTLNAPTSTQAGTYTGTVTFTVG